MDHVPTCLVYGAVLVLLFLLIVKPATAACGVALLRTVGSAGEIRRVEDGTASSKAERHESDERQASASSAC